MRACTEYKYLACQANIYKYFQMLISCLLKPIYFHLECPVLVNAICIGLQKWKSFLSIWSKFAQVQLAIWTLKTEMTSQILIIRIILVTRRSNFRLWLYDEETQESLKNWDSQNLRYRSRSIDYRSSRSPFVYIFFQASSGRETDQNKGLLELL